MRERERERERRLFATLDIHNCMTNKINIAYGRLSEKANAQQAGHLVKKK